MQLSIHVRYKFIVLLIEARPTTVTVGSVDKRISTSLATKLQYIRRNWIEEILNGIFLPSETILTICFNLKPHKVSRIPSIAELFINFFQTFVILIPFESAIFKPWLS